MKRWVSGVGKAGSTVSLPIIELINLSRIYVTGGGVEVRALQDVSLKILPGEFVAIMGQSGSGKSTLMNILGCLDRPSSGSYLFSGKNINTFDSDALASLRREAFGFIFQSYNLLGTETAIGNVQIPAVYKGLSFKERFERASQLLSSLGLGDRINHRPMQLSGGQQQRVSIARAMMNGGTVILADEPTGALDSSSGKEVLALLKSLTSQGKTVILITHDPMVAKHAERVVELRDGKVISDIRNSTSAISEKQPFSFSVENIINKKIIIFSSIQEASRMALRSLRSNLFRTILTLLGIVIGVSSVVTMMAIGEGAQQNIISIMDQLGTNVMTLRPERDPNSRRNVPSTLTVEDANRISQEVPNVSAAIPQMRLGNATVRFGRIDTQTSVVGTSEVMPLVDSWSISRGVFFTDEDSFELNPVAVLGSQVAADLFIGNQEALGQYILINSVPFQVIGILNQKGSQGFNNPDDAVYIPYGTAVVRVFGQKFADEIRILVEDTQYINQTESNILEFVRSIHGTNDVRINQNTAMLESASATIKTLTILLAAVAAISLLVGGIGVMNIMLVSVTERTREIGIRMATGARELDILLQFLTEAIVVTVMGGLIGVIFGISLALVIGYFGIPIYFSGTPILLALSCSMTIGLIFGFMPARKASKLDPVIALANE